VRVDVAHETSTSLHETVEQAFKDLEHKRGGALLAATLLGGADLAALVEAAVLSGALFVATRDGVLVGVALVRSGVLEALYVEPAHRRRGIARALVNAVVADRGEILDAYALPGDRAMKSLYESFGWKTRLLTMRGE
jgi:GNAT superfamily N-acetyltransferase